jgi:NCAIR mutase (PurE)-related protein
MDIKQLLQNVQSGNLAVEDALKQLEGMPYENLGYARVDHHRKIRQGFPEVIFCQGKKPEQVAGIAQNIASRGDNVLATRADEAAFLAVKAVLPTAIYYSDARIIEVKCTELPKIGSVAICTAGTADIPVAQEAAITAEAFGCNCTRIFDVGVAGIHRLFDRLDEIRSANVVIAVAGMEGALASVIGGLVDKPCIAVPTSIGYGASFGGLAALLTMLNSCAAGVSVVNIDNGFGAGVMAAQINRLINKGA